jgi:glycerol-3-phosphate dehydrogenase subunit C
VTAVYDPSDPRYLDPGDLHAEMDRVFDLCQGCRLCFNLCPSFPTLFELIDARDGQTAALDATERNRVVDECYQCKLCYLKCPYVPPHEWELDFPRLMLRVQAQRHESGKGIRAKLTDQVLGRTDLVGRVSSALAPIVNRSTGRPGSQVRRGMERTLGIASERVLPPYTRQRFSTWFKRRRPRTPAVPGAGPAPQASVYATCFVEYMEPAIGRDLVAVLEHNGVDCSLPDGTVCCGAPWLHSGNVAKFDSVARSNLAALVRQVREGRDVVVAQPTCAYVIRKDYPVSVGGADAQLVAEHTFDPAEYLFALRRRGHELSTDFPGRRSGAVPDAVTYHVACHLQAEQIGLKSRDLLALAGVRCDLVQRCSGIDGTWGYRAENLDLARQVATKMAKEIEAAGNPVVCGDCRLANGSIEQETGTRPVHPIQLMARAYGLAEET